MDGYSILVNCITDCIRDFHNAEIGDYERYRVAEIHGAINCIYPYLKFSETEYIDKLFGLLCNIVGKTPNDYCSMFITIQW